MQMAGNTDKRRSARHEKLLTDTGERFVWGAFLGLIAALFAAVLVVGPIVAVLWLLLQIPLWLLAGIVVAGCIVAVRWRRSLPSLRRRRRRRRGEWR